MLLLGFNLKVMTRMPVQLQPSSSTGSLSISATYASIHIARSTAGFATGYAAVGNYVSVRGAASTEYTGSMLDKEKLVLELLMLLDQLDLTKWLNQPLQLL